MNFPGAGLPTWTRSAVTSSPDARLNEAHGLGIRPNVIFWIGCPVAEFMMVAMILITGPVPGGAALRLRLDRGFSTSGQYDTCLHVPGSFGTYYATRDFADENGIS